MNQRKKWFFYMKLYPLLILIVILFMCVGYATINGIDLSVSGDALALLKDGIYVTEALYSESDVANVSESYIKSSTGSILNSHIVLSDTDPDSSITYKVTIYNGLEYNYQFVSAEFDNNFYDNTDITFEISDELNTNTILEPTDSVVFYITFKYASGVTPSSENNILNGYVNINFEFAPTVVATYDYTGNEQFFKASESGIYKIELWGASGNNHYNDFVSNGPAYGGYTSGEIAFAQNQEIYVYVGGKNKLFNMSTKVGMLGGGGATDVRIVNGEWSSFESLASRIMVAGGSGGNYTDSSSTRGGHAGGLMSTSVLKSVGSTSAHDIKPATQTSGGPAMYKGIDGSFGIGGINSVSSYNTGGGGYYGGGGGATSAGGSSFISGHNGCVAITEDSTEDNIIQRNDSSGNVCIDGTTDIMCSYHYSDYIFNNTVMIDGGGYVWTTVKANSSTGMPTHDGSGTMKGNDGNGYAKITLLSISE